jgi:hypothetical protein
MYLDLTEYEIRIENDSPFFIGLEFVEATGTSAFEDFNITCQLIPDRLTFLTLKGIAKPVIFVPFNPDYKTGLSLKHRLFYSFSA